MTIHPTAIVDPDARLGENVNIGPFSIIHGNVVIGEGTRIGSHCEIGVQSALGDGSALSIGAGSNIRSHSVFYESSVFGRNLVTGHRVTVRELTKAGENFQIGTLSDLQGHCEIGDFVRFHSNVHVGQHTRFGNFIWVFPYVVFTNDPHPPSDVLDGATIGDFAAIATMSTILPGVSVGEGALVGACSAVTRDVDPHRIAVGNPAQDRGPTSKVKLRDGSGDSAYPWKNRFHRGYPKDVVAGWIADIDKM